jgi:hypothetical protein
VTTVDDPPAADDRQRILTEARQLVTALTAPGRDALRAYFPDHKPVGEPCLDDANLMAHIVGVAGALIPALLAIIDGGQCLTERDWTLIRLLAAEAADGPDESEALEYSSLLLRIGGRAPGNARVLSADPGR